jgi:hypothetical protein
MYGQMPQNQFGGMDAMGYNAYQMNGMYDPAYNQQQQMQ